MRATPRRVLLLRGETGLIMVHVRGAHSSGTRSGSRSTRPQRHSWPRCAGSARLSVTFLRRDSDTAPLGRAQNDVDTLSVMPGDVQVPMT